MRRKSNTLDIMSEMVVSQNPFPDLEINDGGTLLRSKLKKPLWKEPRKGKV